MSGFLEDLFKFLFSKSKFSQRFLIVSVVRENITHERS